MPGRARFVAPLAVAAAVAAVHALLAFRQPGPALLWDGTAYLSLARWVAGEHTPDLGHLGQYHVGWPILLAPVVWATSTLDGLFDGVRLVHVALAAGGSLTLLALARRLGVGPPAALLVAAAGGVYPGLAMQSGLEWAQVLTTILTWLTVLALHWSGRGGGARTIAPALLAAVGYLVHPTALVGLVAVVVVLAAATRPWTRAVPGLVTALAAGGGAWALNRWALHELWAPGAPSQSAGLFDRVTDPGQWDDLAVRALGSLWYVGVASLGLAALGVAGLVVLARRDDPAERAVGWWVGLSLAGTVALTATKFAAPVRPDHLVYGRYVDAFVPLLLLVALAPLLRRRAALVAAAVGVALTLVAAAVVVGDVPASAFDGVTMPANLFGILALDGAGPAGVDVWRVTAFGLAAAAIVLVVHLGWRRPAATAAVALVAYLGADVHVRDSVRPLAEETAASFQLGEVLRRVPGPATVAYDRAVFDARGTNRYLLAAQDRRFAFYDSRRGERPSSPLVVAGQDPAAPPAPGARTVFPEPYREQMLWVTPGSLQDRFAAAGLLVVRPGEPLPREFFRGGVVDLTARRGAVEVVVRKGGGGAPWVRAHSAPGMAGVVDVAVEVAGRTWTAPLPRTLYRDETVRVLVEIPDLQGRRRFRAALVVDGGTAFGARVGNLRFP